MIGWPKAILVRHCAPFSLLLILGASCTDRDLPLGPTPNKPAFEIQDGPVTPAAFYVANFTGNSITVYAAGAAGNATPAASIAGSNTGLSVPVGIALDATGRLYVIDNFSNTITIYAPGAAGDATPAATIAGSNTGLNRPVGIAVDATGRLYGTNFGSGNFSIVIYTAGASGNATPAATIMGSNTGLNQPQFVALQGATPPQAINSLIGQVISPSLGFSKGEKTSLTAKLQAALGYLQAGDTP